jgi:hypothetical protein
VISTHIDEEPSIVELMSAVQSVILTIARRMQLVEGQPSWACYVELPKLMHGNDWSRRLAHWDDRV